MDDVPEPEREAVARQVADNIIAGLASNLELSQMTKNMGTTDRVIRILAAIGIAVLYFTSSISGVVAIVLAAVGVASLATSLVGFCPAYVPLGISTRGHGAESVHV